jgi:hypothetical protein
MGRQTVARCDGISLGPQGGSGKGFSNGECEGEYQHDYRQDIEETIFEHFKLLR